MNNAFAPRKADSTVSLLDAYMVPCLRLCVSTLLLLVIGGLIGPDAEAAADCGKLNQKACKVTLLRLKACDWGLHKDKSSGRCVRNKSVLPPKQKNCGKLGQVACKVTVTRLKACDLGLHKDKRSGRCVKNKPILPPKQENCGKLGQMACKVTVTRLKACDFGLHRDKWSGRCVENKPILPPKQENCGKLGQMACKVTLTRLKACDFGLHRDKQTGRCVENRDLLRPDKADCGKLNQRACKKWERLFACDKGLRRYPPTGLCVERKDVDIASLIETAGNVKDESIGLIKIMATGYNCYLTNPPAKLLLDESLNVAQKKKGFLAKLKQAVEDKDVDFALLLAESKCIRKVVDQAEREGYRTLTLGYSGGGALLVGAFADNGFAFDVAGLDRFFENSDANEIPLPTFYQTKAVSGGIQAGVVGGINLGLYKGASAADARGSDTHGVTFEAGVGIGGGVGIWFDYDGKLDGISASGIVGASGKAGAYNRINTSYYNLDGPTYVDCGAIGQRACRPWESVPACQGGRHNLTTGMCEGEAVAVQLDCGATGQRVCTVEERVPGCDAGLKIDYQTKRCVSKVQKRRLDCGAAGQRVCTVEEQVPGCNSGLRIDYTTKLCATK